MTFLFVNIDIMVVKVVNGMLLGKGIKAFLFQFKKN